MTLFDKNLLQLDFDVVRSEIADEGCCVLGEPVSSSAMDDLRAVIDRLAEDEATEVNYGGSEHRIWQAHTKNELIDQFRLFSDQVISGVVEKQRYAHDILAIRNRPIQVAASELVNGRWHMDSFNGQLKVFMFLNDVTDRSGAFEMILKTQRQQFKTKNLLKGELITLSDIFSKTRSYASLQEEMVEKIIAQGYQSRVFDVRAGTLALIDTSCIHRASPCIEGERYALTAYYH